MTRFGVWRAAVATVLAMVWSLVAAWTVSQARAEGGAPGALVGTVAVIAVAAAAWLAAGLLRVRPFALRWDGRGWALASERAEPVAGELVATVDVGAWLLLRFVPGRPGPVTVPRWLPVQRRGLEASWHALRCAVHSPRSRVM